MPIDNAKSSMRRVPVWLIRELLYHLQNHNVQVVSIIQFTQCQNSICTASFCPGPSYKNHCVILSNNMVAFSVPNSNS